jgi:hypothetical protein
MLLQGRANEESAFGFNVAPGFTRSTAHACFARWVVLPGVCAAEVSLLLRHGCAVEEQP